MPMTCPPRSLGPLPSVRSRNHSLFYVPHPAHLYGCGKRVNVVCTSVTWLCLRIGFLEGVKPTT